MTDRRAQRRTQIAHIGEMIGSMAMAISPVAGPEPWLELDLTMGQVKTLMVVRHHGLTRIGRVAHDLGLSANATTAAVDRLEVAGLVSRQPDPADRRAVLVSATPTGEQFVFDLMTTGIVAFNQHLERLTDSDLDALSRGLEALLAVIDSDGEQKPIVTGRRSGG